MGANTTSMKKGHAKRGGRPKGAPNKTSARSRELIALVAEENAHKIGPWLDEIYTTEGPNAALSAYLRLLEYHIPKLARQELVGDEGAPVQVEKTLNTDCLSDSALEELMAARPNHTG